MQWFVLGLFLGGLHVQAGQGEVAPARPAAIRAEWAGWVGSYGDPLAAVMILEREGRLWAIVNRRELVPLESGVVERSGDTARCILKADWPRSPLQVWELRLRKGEGESLMIGTQVFARRRWGKETWRTRLSGLPQVLAKAARSTPPKEAASLLRGDWLEPATLAVDLRLQPRYASTNNFLGVALYPEPLVRLRRPVAEALVRVHQRLKAEGYGLLVWDAYRPWAVTKVMWDAVPAKYHDFVSDPAKGSRHNRGAAVDVTLCTLSLAAEVDMGGEYDEMTERSYADYPGGTSLQRWHRALLRRAMEAEGFSVLPEEWWHYDYKDWRTYAIE